jgi:hypothetical protein
MAVYRQNGGKRVDVQFVRQIAALLLETADLSTSSALRFEVRKTGFAWSWHERIAPNRPRRPRLDVLAVRCPPEERDAILSSDPNKFFTEDHYRGFPAVLVRLDEISRDELRALLTAAWRCQALQTLVKTAKMK